MEERINYIVKLLPKYNCKACGYKRCDLFAEALLKGEDIEKCPFLFRDDFRENLNKIRELLKDVEIKLEKAEKEIVGLIDGYNADFVLAPLPDEHSCRETLLIFDKKEIEIGDIIRYRPLGCPITHFAKVIDKNYGLYVVHLVGPCHRINNKEFNYKDVGIAMVVAFEGIVKEGKIPEVGKTVKFLPEHCMMQKVHSGVVVEVEGRRV
jgi:uncharacterized Fe-S cluster-containing protein